MSRQLLSASPGSGTLRHATLENPQLSMKLWKRNKSSYPAANLSDIGADTSYLPGGLPVCPVDGTAYTINTTTGRVTGHTH